MKGKRYILLIIITLLLIILTITGDAFSRVNDRLEIKFRWKNWDKSEWTSYDKYVHCAGGWILTSQIDKNNTWFNSFFLGQACSLLWESKDALIKWETAGYWGGDGFDLKDHIAFTAGQLGQGLLDHVLFKKSIYDNKQLKKIVKKRLNKGLYNQQ